MPAAGTLYVIPTTLGEGPPDAVVPARTLQVARQLRQQPDRAHRWTLHQFQPSFAGGRHHAGQVSLVPERQPDRLHFLRLAMGEIGDRAMFDLAGFAIGLAQQVTGVGLAVEAGGRTVYEHYDY